MHFYSKINCNKLLVAKKKEKLHKRVPNYSVFSLKGTNVAKRSIECMKLSKPFNVGYSVTLRSKSMTEAKTRAFHVIFQPRTTTFAPHLNDRKDPLYSNSKHTLLPSQRNTAAELERSGSQTFLSNNIVKMWVFIIGHYPSKLHSYFRL
jgi:hypothetical protein